MQLSPYLMFKGDCQAAFRFYERELGGQIETMITHGETPAADHVPKEWQEKIIHARMTIGQNVLMASDAPPAHQADIRGVSLTLMVDTPAQAERIFNALAEGGTVQMPLGETFYAVKFGMLVDRFGVAWMINCEKAPAVLS